MRILNGDSEWGLCMGILNGDFKRDFKWEFSMWILNGDFVWGF